MACFGRRRKLMHRDTCWAHRLRILTAAVGATALFTARSYSSISLYDPNSSARITHDSDTSSGLDPILHKNVDTIPSSGSIFPNNIYSYGPKPLSYTLNGNTASSSAQGSIGAVTNSLNVGFT